MPHLTWDSKSTPQPLPAKFQTDSLLFPRGNGYPLSPDHPVTNHLFHGDNLALLSALLPEWEGRLNLIYADPPFFTNKRYPARVGRGEDSRKPREWALSEGYPDHWSTLDSYLDFLYPRLWLMRRLLAPTGTLYLHLDWHADAYARLLLDEIFGAERLLNEIVWVYHGPSPIRSAFNRKHDTILVYTSSKDYIFNADAVREPYNPNTVKTFESSPKAGFGKVPDLERGKVPEDWWYFPVVARLHNERTGYPTQKPEALLERIILASSTPGDWVADFFCGSGTTPLVASRTGRRFIASDVNWWAVHTTRARLVESQEQPFMLGREVRAQISEGQPDFEPQLALTNFGSDISLQITDEALLAALDYWEVDPCWDGKIFHSAAQATRPRRKGKIPAALQLPAVGKTICVRLVMVSGEQLQAVLHI